MTLKNQAIKMFPFWSLADLFGTRRSKYGTYIFFSTTDILSFKHVPRWNDGTWGVAISRLFRLWGLIPGTDKNVVANPYSAHWF
jgi:hypothetical protein